MSAKQVGPHSFRSKQATLILIWLGVLSGCGDKVADATRSTDGGVGNTSSGGASSGGTVNAGGTSTAPTGGSTASAGAGNGTASGGSAGRAGTGGMPGTAGNSSGGSAGSGTAGAETGGAGGSAPLSHTCTNAPHVLPMNASNPQDGITLSGFYVDTDTWNAANYQVTQTMYVCDYNNWYVVANMNNSKGDGAVKTYPNVHQDFNSAPQISSFTAISSRFAHTAPHLGIYEFAYDIWLNGVATNGSTEVMIWTDNYKQVPSGSSLETVNLDGQSYNVYKSGNYIAFVESSNVSSGTLNLLTFFNHIISKGWIPASSTLGAIDYGIEIVSTDSTDATFAVNDFSLTTK